MATVQENRDELLRRLRSGEYKQGRGRLRRGDRFCCLGVMCDIVDPEGWDKEGFWNHERNFPTSEVMAVFGLLTAPWIANDPMIGKQGATASALNDSGRNFPYIADRFEAHFKEHPAE